MLGRSIDDDLAAIRGADSGGDQQEPPQQPRRRSIEDDLASIRGAAGGSPALAEHASETPQQVDERGFRSWYSGVSNRYGLDPNPDDPRHFYDWRGAYQAGAQPTLNTDDNRMHWPSEFKRLGHPNLVVDGVDTRTGLPPSDLTKAAQLTPGFPGPGEGQPIGEYLKKVAPTPPPVPLAPVKQAPADTITVPPIPRGVQARAFTAQPLQSDAARATIAPPTGPYEEDVPTGAERQMVDKATGEVTDLGPQTRHVIHGAPSQPGVGDYLLEAGNTFAHTMGEDAGKVASFMPVLADRLRKIASANVDLPEGQQPEKAAVNIPVQQRTGYQVGQAIRGWAEKTYPEDQRLQKSLIAHTIPAAAATIGSFMGAEALAGPVGGAALMAAEGGGQELQSAIESGANDDTALQAGRWGALPGLAYAAVPAAGKLLLGEAAAPGVVSSIHEGMAQAAKHGARGALEMGVASALDQFGHNAVAHELYDQDRPLMQGVTDSAAGGSAAAFILSSLLHARGMRLVSDADGNLGWEDQAAKDHGPTGPADPYGVIGVSPKATDEEINRVYRQRLKDLQPQLSSDPRVQTMFQNLNVARDKIFRERAGGAPVQAGDTAPRPAGSADTAAPPTASTEQGAPATAEGAPLALERPAVDRLGTPLAPQEAAPAESGLSIHEQHALAEVRRRVQIAQENGQRVDPDEIGRMYQELVEAGKKVGTAVAAPDDLPPRADAGLPRETPPPMQQGHSIDADLAAIRQAAPSAASAPNVFNVNPTTDLDLEPGKYQYKESNPETGDTGVLAGNKKWNPDLAGVVQVTKGEDNRYKVVNGHQRVNLARRLAVPQVLVRDINAKTPGEARLVGALTNISEGSGTALDAAKVLRESGMGVDQLDAAGVPRTSKIAKDGLALAQLHPALFDQVARGKLPTERAAIYGRSGLAPEQQLALNQLVQAREGKKKTAMTNGQIEELARFVKSAGSENVSQETLFGTDTQAQSLAIDKAKLSSWLTDRLGRQARLFKFVSKGDRAGELEGAGDGTIDTGKATGLGTEAEQVLEVYRRLSVSAGPVSDALNEAVRQIRGGGSEQAVRNQLYASVKRAVQDVFSGGSAASGGDVGGAESGAPGEGAGEAGAGAAPPPVAAPPAPGTTFSFNDARRAGADAARRGDADRVPDHIDGVGHRQAWQEGYDAVPASERPAPKRTAAPVAKPPRSESASTLYDPNTTNLSVAGKTWEQVAESEHPSHISFLFAHLLDAVDDGRVSNGEAARVEAILRRRAPNEMPRHPMFSEAAPAPTEPAGEGPGLFGDEGMAPDLFGNEDQAPIKQGELLTTRPQGMTDALNNARATVSSLEGKLERGTATATEQRRYAEAQSLLRREEGRGLGPGEVRPSEAAETPEGEEPLALFDHVREAAIENPKSAAAIAHGVSSSSRMFEAGFLPEEQKEATLKDGTVVHPIAPVEMLRTIQEAMADEKFQVLVKRLRTAWGHFAPPGAIVGKHTHIALNPDLAGDYAHFARTFAHEIGHAIDYLDDKTLARGTILGRIASLRRFMGDMVAAEPNSGAKPLTEDERKDLRTKAMETAGEEPTRKTPEWVAWAQTVAAEYRKLLETEMDARGLIGRQRIAEELIAVSMNQRGSLGMPGTNYFKYRASSVELYADAVSSLFNSPGSLQEFAPTFFDAFFAYLGNKPNVKAAYDGIQDLVSPGNEQDLFAEREAKSNAGVSRFEEIIRSAERVNRWPQPFRQYLKQLLVVGGAPVTEAENASLKAKKGGQPLMTSTRRAAQLALEEVAHADNDNALLLNNIEEHVWSHFLDHDLSEEDAHNFLTMTRIAEGDRAGMAEKARQEIIDVVGPDQDTGETRTWARARIEYMKLRPVDPSEPTDFDAGLLDLAEGGFLNPGAYTRKTALEFLDGLKTKLGDEKYAALETAMKAFRDIQWDVVKNAGVAGVYSQEMMAKIAENKDYYAPFVVLDYFQGTLTGSIRQQIGTVKEIGNTFTAGLMKMLSLQRMTSRQFATTKVLAVALRDMPGDIGPEQSVNRYKRETRPGPGRENVMYYVDGKLRYREMSDFTARTLNRGDAGVYRRILDALSSKVYGIFHPLWVTWNAGWALMNMPRDFQRTYVEAMTQARAAAREAGMDVNRFKALPADFFWNLPRAYLHAKGESWQYARLGEMSPTIQLMLKDRAFGELFTRPTPKAGLTQRQQKNLDGLRAIGRANLTSGQSKQLANLEAKLDDSTKYDRMVEQFLENRRLWEERKRQGAKTLGLRGAKTIVKDFGAFTEVLGKVAAFDMVTNHYGVRGQQAAAIVRNYAGTPDSRQRGAGADAANSLRTYWNVITAGFRSAYNTGTHPKTATDYWLSAVMTQFLPKALMAAMLAGALGTFWQDYMRKVDPYDREKYIIIPAGWKTMPDGSWKPRYIRWPHEDAIRPMASAFWGLITGQDKIGAVGRNLTGELPNASPLFTIPAAWIDAFTDDVSPRDEFRGRDIVPKTDWDANDWHKWNDMLRWTVGELGVVGQLFGFYTNARPDASDTSVEEKVERAIPGVSRVIKVSDYGIEAEQGQAAKDRAQELARARARTSEADRSKVSRMRRLQTFRRTGKLTDAQETELDDLSSWYRGEYLPQLDSIRKDLGIRPPGQEDEPPIPR